MDYPTIVLDWVSLAVAGTANDLGVAVCKWGRAVAAGHLLFFYFLLGSHNSSLGPLSRATPCRAVGHTDGPMAPSIVDRRDDGPIRPILRTFARRCDNRRR